MINRTHLTLLLLVFGLLAWIPTAQAAEQRVILQGPVGQARVGESLALDILLDSDGQRINAADLTVRFDPAALTVERVARERSMFTLWPEEPSWDNSSGLVHVTGGRPGGLYAVRGLVATVYFTPIKGGTATVTLDAASASYLNNNVGSKVSVSAIPFEIQVASDLLAGLSLSSPTHPTPTSWSRTGRIVIRWAPDPAKEYSFRLAADSQAVPDDTPDQAVGELQFEDLADGVYYFTIKERVIQGDWQPILQRRFLIDGTPPAAFTIEKLDPADVAGQAVISWGANDITSGVSRSVLAVDGRVIGEVTSPLTLRAEWVGKQVEVTVIDAAGNSRSKVWPVVASQPLTKQPWAAAVVVLIMGIIAFVFFRRFKLFH